MSTTKKEQIHHLKAGRPDVGLRLDSWLSERPEIPSRTFVQHLIELGLVSVNDNKVTKHYQLKLDDQVSVTIPPSREMEVLPENIPLNIIYEDGDMIVLSKPAGKVVHPAHGHHTGTLVNALLAHTKDLSGIGGVKRPGIIHRLDKDTSGLMIVAKNDFSHLALSKALKERAVKRVYLALVHGQVPVDSGVIEIPIGRSEQARKKMAVLQRKSREAVTSFRVKKRFAKYTLLELALGTGRTHQIRVHLSFIGHPVVGDQTYGRRKTDSEFGLKRQFLHAYRLEFVHPRSGKELKFEDELPEDLQKVLDLLDRAQAL